DRIRDLAGFIVRGCAATESERIHAGAVEGIKAWKALPGDDGARRDRILEDLDLLKAWLKPMISSSVSWHLLVDVTPGDHGQLWRRYGVARRLLIDLLEEARSLPGRVRSSR
ncbi:MAG: hypothetical protein ACE5GW_14325, partial [Planctomycetota bacterium]